MRNLLLIVGIICFVCQANIKGQELKYRPFQVTWITPIGTNGANSLQYTNELSLNILIGYNGGLDGFEVGGFGNVIKQDAIGFQGAGFGNIVLGSMEGAQISGFANIANNDSKGLQLTGFGNVNGGGFNGLQGAGFVNIADGNSDALQIAGFGNLNSGDLEGIQLAGFANITNNLEGVQGAGFANIARNVKGAQIAGFANIAKNVEGIQLGVFNICDSIDGIPIGVFSFVRKGYKAFEFWSSESLHMNFSFKMGVKKFYNILAVGGNFRNGFNLGLGYGVGSEFDIAENTIFNFELLSWDINKNWLFNDNVMLNQMRLNFGMKFNENQSFFVGPTINVLLTDTYNSNINPKTFAPYYFMNHTTPHGINIKSWIGLNGGIRF